MPVNHTNNNNEITKLNNDQAYRHFLTLPENDGRFAEGGLRTKGLLKKSKPDQPLITIITAVFNGDMHLEETITSIINQSYPNIEFIIIDGGSSDNTLNIIKKYENKIDYWVSEKDQGISDAFNKGICLANGDYINFQGDGDGFFNNEIISTIFSKIVVSPVFISGKIQRIDQNGNELFQSKYIQKFKKYSLLFKMALPHQGLFTHINYFKQYGLFDVKNKYCMDYEHLLRSFKNFPEVTSLDLLVANWRADGLGNGKTLEIYKEYDKIKRQNQVASSFILSLINYWTLIKYLLKKIITGDI